MDGGTSGILMHGSYSYKHTQTLACLSPVLLFVL